MFGVVVIDIIILSRLNVIDGSWCRAHHHHQLWNPYICVKDNDDYDAAY